MDIREMRRQVRVPKGVASAVVERWPDQGQAWCESVESELAELCAKYHAIPTSTFQARYGFVVEVDTGGALLVMRSSPDPQGIFQAKTAIALAGLDIAPQVHEVIQTATGTWNIMDRVQPGTSIADSPASVEKLAALLRPAREQEAPTKNMPLLVDWLRDRLASDKLSDLPVGRAPASPAERESAMAILSELMQDCVNGLCHGDVSRRNVLTAADGRLMLVDPRGVSGEISYDVAVVALKTARSDNPMDRAAVLAELVGVDPERTRAWLSVADSARV